MVIKKIRAQGFRNLNKLSIDLNDQINIFYGKNGQGKTNLLETIYLASRGTSFRPGKIDQWKSRDVGNTDLCFLEFSVQEDQFTHEVRIFWDHSKKNILLDGKKTTTGRLVQLLPVILFSPESLSAIKDGPEKRRTLVDDMVLSSFEDQQVCQQFKKALKNRNRFLKECKEQGKADESLMLSLDILFLNFSTKLSLARVNYLNRLDPFTKKALGFIFGGELDFIFDYLISDQSVKNFTETEIRDLHEVRVKELRQAEMRVGSSLVGAHKHDVKFLVNGRDSRFFSSQGQQRGLILSLKIAEVLYKISKGIFPILLLDDVLSELDLEKKERFLEFLRTLKTQIFITTTESVSLTELKGNHFFVSKGNIIAEEEINTRSVLNV